VIANKMDLNPYTKFEHYFERTEDRGQKTEDRGQKVEDRGQRAADAEFLSTVSEAQWVPISALEKMNIGFLKEKLYQSVLTEQVQVDSTIVSNARHFEALKKASESLDDVLQAMDSGITSDFVAMDIRRALSFLGEITGEISTDDLLGNIFGKFCIGK
nr:hypothetical protein [Saprospiraceae bacterium]